MTGEEIESLENSKVEKGIKDSGGLLIGFLSQQRPNQAHLMKKATLQGLFALGPIFNKNVYKDKWQWLTPGTVWTGVPPLPMWECHFCFLPLFCHPWRSPMAQIEKGGFSHMWL